MNRINIIILALLCLATNIYASNTSEKGTLHGIIKDKTTGEAIPGVTIYLPDLQKGTSSDIDGKYLLQSLPNRKVLLQISFIGYKTIVETVDLTKISEKNFEMETSATELNEVVVTGQSGASEQKRTATPILIVDQKLILENSSTNIIDAIAMQPGVSQITTGSGISKPVIRGLGYNRVVVVNDNVRQEGQQWGDEHGIEIDEASIDKIEILKGPASLSYGSDAMAGVVNMLSAPSPIDGKIMGSIATNYQSNNGLMAVSADAAGNSNGKIWEVRYSNKMAHDYKNAYDGYVYNSGFRENAADVVLGLNKAWGYSKIKFSMYNFTPGIVDGSRDSATGKFTKAVDLNGIASYEIVPQSDFKSYTPSIAYQKIHHDKILFDNSIFIKGGTLKATFAFQQNSRQEYGDILAPNQYGLWLLMNTISYDIHYNLPEKKGYTLSFGSNGMEQISQNKGIEFLVPDYNLFDAGAFIIGKKEIGAFDISGGIRYDNRNEHGSSLFLNSAGTVIPSLINNGDVERFKAFSSTFKGTSGSIGATWQITENVFTKANLSRGFRSPNIGELGANGVHDGTSRYELGDPNLKRETSLQLDYALGIHSKHVVAEIDLFDNNINNYIFPTKLSSVKGGDSLTDGFSTYKFISGNAQLLGGEISIDIHPHPLDWLHFENAFSYVRATQKKQADSTKYLPYTPPAKLQTGLKADISIKQLKTLRSTYVKIDIDNYFAQNNIYSAMGTETKTPGYTLVNIGMGTDFMRMQKKLCSLYLGLNNAFNKTYQSHLSRLKYLDENYATGRIGVYNMGRNLSVKIIIPFNVKRSVVKG
jgi:iron complex outermembrane receptor protein